MENQRSGSVEEALVKRRHDGAIATVTLNRPAQFNALSEAMIEALHATLDAASREHGCSVIVLAAEGRAFCAGLDTANFGKMASGERGGARLLAGERTPGGANPPQHSVMVWREIPVPVIAAVHGFVLGGGIGICGAADIVIAADDASFGLPEVDRGAMGGAAHLQRMFGVQKTRYLFFTGEMIGAPEALRLGAIERVVPRAALRDEALAIAAKIAAKSPAMIRIAKEALTGIEDGNLEAKYRWEQGFTLQAYLSPDSAETRRAFVDKRDAKF